MGSAEQDADWTEQKLAYPSQQDEKKGQGGDETEHCHSAEKAVLDQVLFLADSKRKRAWGKESKKDDEDPNHKCCI